MSDPATSTRLTLTERLLKISEVAALIGVTASTVYKLIDHTHELQGVSLGPNGGSRRVPESSLASYLTSRGIPFTLSGGTAAYVVGENATSQGAR